MLWDQPRFIGFRVWGLGLGFRVSGFGFGDYRVCIGRMENKMETAN